MQILFPLLFLALICFWLYQFVQLMLLSDRDFPGTYDKILWVLAFVLVFFVAPFAFFFWKKAFVALRNPGPVEREGKEIG
jgi:hypothetical protein